MTYITGTATASAPERVTLAPRASSLGALDLTAAQQLGVITSGGGLGTLGWVLLAAGIAFIFGYVVHQPVQAVKQRARRRAAAAVAHTIPTWQVLIMAATIAGGAYMLAKRNKGATT